MSDPTWSALQKSAAIIPKIGGAISIVSCSLLIRDVALKWKENRSIPFPTLMIFAIAIPTLIQSFFQDFMTTWMVPDATHNQYQYHQYQAAYLAAGTTASCTFQGFVSLTCIMLAGLYYTELAIVYWGTVRHGWTETKMKQTWFRVAFFLPPVVVSLGLTVPPLFYELYNFSGLSICQIVPYPMECVWGLAPCERGSTESLMIFFYLLVGTGVLYNVTIVVFMVMLTHAIWKQERAMDRFLTPGQEKRRKQTRRTYKQGVRYVVSYLICWMPTFIWAIIDHSHGPPVVLVYMNLIIAPLWGFFLGGVYFVPRYETYREKNPSGGRLQALVHVLNIDIDLLETTLASVDDTTGNETTLASDDDTTGNQTPLLSEIA
mmetsp:Transcript_14944/g.34699  ORF Transcript_14944/g.34699 Transcript_14944/m.34699 type:complete len:375 (-) Transcript_14944:3999-5123(-)